MKSSTLGMIAGGAIVLAAAAALVVNQTRRATSIQEYGGLVYPDLAAKAPTVTEIAVNSAGAVTTVRKQGDAWLLVEKGGYPVKIEKVREVVVGLGQLKQLEPKTSKAERYAEIGVEDPPATPAVPATPDPTAPPAEKSQAALVTLKDSSGATLASAIVGKQRFGTPPTVFIRKAGDSQSWLAEGQLDVPREVNGWLDTQVINLPRERVARVTITPAEEGATPLAVSRPTKDDASFAVESLPDGVRLKAPTAADPVTTALSYLNFDDVALASSVMPADGPAPVTYTLATFDGMVVTSRVVQKDGRYWAAFDASIDESKLPQVPQVTPPEPPAPGAAVDPAVQSAYDVAKKVADEAAKKVEDVRKEVKTLNDRHGGWAYAIPEYKGKVLVTRLDELLTEEEAPASTEPAGPAVPDSLDPVPVEPK